MRTGRSAAGRALPEEERWERDRRRREREEERHLPDGDVRLIISHLINSI